MNGGFIDTRASRVGVRIFSLCRIDREQGDLENLLLCSASNLDCK